MDSIRQYNEEQFQMLCLAVTDTSSGICLFEYDDVRKQVEIAKRVSNTIEKDCIVIDVSKLESDKMPDGIEKLRELLTGKESAQVVILCNLQLCGEAIGDRQYIEKINYMRDQMLAMQKVWVLGMSRYFAVMLSRKARDLYSCIMNHFDFKEVQRDSLLEFTEIEFFGDKKFSLLRFKELQERINRNGIDTVNEDALLQVIAEWNKIHECCNLDTNKWIQKILQNVEKKMRILDFQPDDCIKYQQVAKAWNYLGKADKALNVAELIEENALKLLPADGQDMADIYRMLAGIHFSLKRYEEVEEYSNKALVYYSEKKNGISHIKVDIVNVLVHMKVSKGLYEDAIHMYEQMIQEVKRDFGVRYFYLIALWNNMGNVYEKLHMYSRTLDCFLKAYDLFEYNKEYVSWRETILRNIGIIYGMIGDYKKAIYYLKEAEAIAERLDSALVSVRRKKSIYKLLKKYYHEDSQKELAKEYAFKLSELDKEG